MSSIITVTLNPAIDKSTAVEKLVAEKKMKCSRPRFEPGGGGINVARAIKKLGGKAKSIYPAGGYTGNFFTQLLDKENITSSVIEINNHTRENLIVFDKSSGQQYRFGMPGPQVEEKEWQELLAVVENINDAGFIVASGSMPGGVPPDIFGRLAAIAKRKNAKLIADTSGEALKHAVKEGVYLIKPNMGELASLSGKDELTVAEAKAAALQLIKTNCSEVIVVSMGAAGALLVTNGGALQFIPPEVKRISTVGAGDSMVAGIVLKLSQQQSLSEAVQYGVACGTAATLNPGTELCKKEDADKLFPQIKSLVV